jgi:hypothetical protein
MARKPAGGIAAEGEKAIFIFFGKLTIKEGLRQPLDKR